MFSGISKLTDRLGLTESDGDSSATPGIKPAEVSAGSPMVRQSPAIPFVAPALVVVNGNADAVLVEQFKASVLSASPILGLFIKNIGIAKGSFPNDEMACMKAALAFTNTDKATLIGELDRTVAASLLQLKKNMEGQKVQARSSAVGGLEQQLQAVVSDYQQMEASIAAQMQAIAEKKAKSAQLQEQVRSAEADLQRQDNTVSASLAQVEHVLASFKQSVSSL